MTAAELATKIDGAKQNPSGEWVGRCPISSAHTHGDQKPSLRWRDSGDKILMSCRAGSGCKNIDIMKALGLGLADLYHHPATSKAPAIVETYDYVDEHGALVQQVVRYADKSFKQRQPDGKDGWIWTKSSRQVLYHLDKLQGAPAVAACEGEKDADRLIAAGILATCNAGGAEKWSDEYTLQLKAAGVKALYIFPDNDEAGEKHAKKIEDSCLKSGLVAWIVRLPGLGPKGDVSDWLDDADENHNTDELRKLLKVMAVSLPTSFYFIPDPEPDADAGVPIAPAEKPVIVAGEGLAEDSDAAWAALLKANNPPVLYSYGDGVYRTIKSQDGHLELREMNQDRLRARLSRVARWLRGLGDKARSVYPPEAVVRDMLANDEPPLPRLRRLVTVPVFAEDGFLINKPGYSPKDGIMYAPPKGLHVPPVPPEPTTDDVAAAVALLVNDLMVDFPFVTPADKAAAVALLLTTFAKGLFDGAIPFFLFEKPTPGTGASLLIAIITRIVLGEDAAGMTEAGTEDEWRKRITACLSTAPMFIVIENLNRSLNSSALSQAITAQTWHDRVLGLNRMAKLPVECCWVGSGNRPTVSTEIARRTIPCHLDARVERPWERDTFKHENLRGWVDEHRGALIHACLVLIQNWVAIGSPPAPRAVGSFEGWARALGGILAAAGIPGLLSNVADFYERADTEGDARRMFLRAWWAEHNDSAVHTKDLMGLAEDSELDIDGKSDKAKQVKLGATLKKLLGRIVTLDEGLVIEVQRPEPKQDNQGSLWRLKEMKPVASMASVATPRESQTFFSLQGGEGDPHPSLTEEKSQGFVGMPRHAIDATPPAATKCHKHPVTPRPQSECPTCPASDPADADDPLNDLEPTA